MKTIIKEECGFGRWIKKTLDEKGQMVALDTNKGRSWKKSYHDNGEVASHMDSEGDGWLHDKLGKCLQEWKRHKPIPKSKPYSVTDFRKVYGTGFSNFQEQFLTNS